MVAYLVIFLHGCILLWRRLFLLPWSLLFTNDIILIPFSTLVSFPPPFFFVISSMRAVATLLLQDVSCAVPYATTFITMQARDMVDKGICAWVANIRLSSIITQQVFESSRYNITVSLPTLDTHTRHERQATANIYVCARFVLYCRLLCLFFQICENELSWCFALCPISQFVTEQLRVLHNFHKFHESYFFFFMQKFFSCMLMEPSAEVIGASFEVVEISMDSTETSSFQ